MFGTSLANRFVIVTLCGTLLAGCQTHDIDFSPEPLVKAQTNYSILSPKLTSADQVWWAAFADAKLDALIREALENNFDVMQVIARHSQASSLTRQAWASQFPQVNLEVGLRQEWREGGERERLNLIGGALAWEVDVFNRLGSAALARHSEQMARLEDIKAVRPSLSAEVAEAYFDAVEQRNQLALLHNQTATDRDLLTPVYRTGGLRPSFPRNRSARLGRPASATRTGAGGREIRQPVKGRLRTLSFLTTMEANHESSTTSL